MTSPIALHPGPAVGFDAPFEMLEACHQRVHRMLRLLERLRIHLAGQGADAPARDAARDVMRYFDIAGPAHHEDEERHVLPRLRAAGHAALADRLHADHRAMAGAWAGVRADLQRVVDGRWPPPPPELAAMRTRWQAFTQAYDEHIEIEDGVAYPAVRAALAGDDEREMGAEMASRRGLAAA